MKFPDSWFEDEIRCGFYVPSLMKRAWAAQLMALHNIGEACKKHDVRWFISSGGLLGAIRHKGYIPWDDDIDIYMLREDFIKFMTSAIHDLPETYTWVNPKETGNCLLTNKISIYPNPFVDEETRKAHFGFPFFAHIDIFIADAIPSSPKEAEQRKVMAQLIQTSLSIVTKQLHFEDETFLGRMIDSIEKLRRKKFDPDQPLKDQLFDLFDQVCKYTYYTKDRHAKYVTVLPYAAMLNSNPLPSEIFADTVMLPFEGTELPAPAGYDAYLRTVYGDYMTPSRAGESHEYPYYGPTENAMRADPDSVFAYPYFQANDKRAEATRLAWHASLDKCRSMASVLGDIQRILERAIMSANAETVLKSLELCQNTAMELGTLLEKTPGADMSGTVELLEQYCDTAYQIYASIVGEPAE